jgi:hypothetical protein
MGRIISASIIGINSTLFDTIWKIAAMSKEDERNYAPLARDLARRDHGYPKLNTPIL